MDQGVAVEKVRSKCPRVRQLTEYIVRDINHYHNKNFLKGDFAAEKGVRTGRIQTQRKESGTKKGYTKKEIWD